MQNWIRKGYIRYIFQYHEQVVCCFPSLGSSRCKTENAFIKVWWCISWPKISLPGKSLGEVHMKLLCTIRFRSSSKSGSLPLSHDAVSSFSRLLFFDPKHHRSSKAFSLQKNLGPRKPVLRKLRICYTIVKFSIIDLRVGKRFTNANNCRF